MIDFDKIEVHETTFAERLLFTNFFENVLKKRLEDTKSSDSISYTLGKYDNEHGLEYRVYIYVCKRFSDQINFEVSNGGYITVKFSTSYYMDTSLDTFLIVCNEIKNYMHFPQLQFIVTDLEVSNRIIPYYKPKIIKFRDTIDNFSQSEFDKFFDQCTEFGGIIPIDLGNRTCKKLFNLLDQTKYTISENNTLIRK